MTTWQILGAVAILIAMTVTYKVWTSHQSKKMTDRGGRTGSGDDGERGPHRPSTR